MTQIYSFTCNCCGQTYTEMPCVFGNDYPNYYYTIPPEERSKRVEIEKSLCIIDYHYFHRGRISIPIIDYHESLIFNVWTTISKENFELRNDIWNDPDRINQPPYFGWLENDISTYEKTIHIKTLVHENEVGHIPTIEIIEENHQLFYDQQNGITFSGACNKVQQILSQLHID